MSPLVVSLGISAAWAAPEQDVLRLAGILDYVAGDYAGAVADGAVVNADEYAEQGAFLDDADALAARLDPARAADTVAGLATLRQQVEALADGEAVAATARGVRRALLDTWAVRLVPFAAPDHDRGLALYATRCASCHGATGGGDGPAAAGLEPPPANFRDPALMAAVTPARAFHALTEGLDGTAMAAYTDLSPSARWDLAYAVLSLRHADADLEAGRAAWARALPASDATYETLADARDLDLAPRLAGLSDAERALALAWARAAAPYPANQGPLDLARQRVREATVAYTAGDHDEAARLAGEAYLAGFEPQEAVLSQRDGALVQALEAAFLEVREAARAPDQADTLTARVADLSALLDRAEGALAAPPPAGGGALASLVVVLREGIEAALLILLLLGLDGRADDPKRTAVVHAGWVSAVAAGFAMWFGAGSLMTMSGASREVLEGVVALVAAAVMLLASHWILARLDAGRRVSAMKEQMSAGAVALGTLFFMAFTAVIREAFEVVLFLKAIQLDAGGATGGVVAGVAGGAALLVAFVVAARRLGRRMPTSQLLTAGGVLLCLIAVVFAGKGVHNLQEAGVVSLTGIGAPRVDLLGLYPSLETVGLQIVVLAVLGATALWTTRERGVPG